MDLGIKGRNAIVCASSKGLGKGCAIALAKEGVNLLVNARNETVLAQTVDEIRKVAPSIKISMVACDITTAEGRARVLQAMPAPDILVNNAGGPPPGDFHDWSREDWIKALDANMLTPIELIKATVDGMAKRKWGRIINITSSSVKAPIPVLGLSNGARSGLTGFIAGIARQMARTGVTINNLLPGRFDTDRIRQTTAAQAQKNNRSMEEELQAAAEQTPIGRFGNIDEFGAFCAFICSTHAAYMTGQNILLDGGTYPGTY